MTPLTLATYTVADMVELVWGNGSNAPVRPCVYELAEKSKAVAIVDLGLHTAQSIIATEWLLAPSITANTNIAA